jgi:hypothetical protein
MKKSNIYQVISLLLFTLNTSASQIYTIDDLKVLYTQKSYVEYLDHALDIRPSKRDKEWSKMTLEMASGHIKSLIQRGVATLQTFNHIEKLAKIPSLKADDFFQLKRTQFAYSYFKSCKGPQCHLLFKEFWRTAKHYPDYDFKFYELFRLRDSETKEYILPYFTKSSGSKFYCKKLYVVTDLYKVLDQAVKYKTIDESKKEVSKYADSECISSLADQLSHRLYNLEKSNQYKITLYKILKSHNLISQSDEDLFFSIYILQGPVVGEIFNMAWNRISKLSQNYKRRQQLLTRLMEQDPLPGKVFAHPDKKKRDTLISFFHKYFPEYIDSYVKTCINYFSGNGEFPLGNPTIQCDDLMKAAKKRSWIQDHLKIKYSGSKKFK